MPAGRLIHSATKLPRPPGRRRGLPGCAVLSRSARAQAMVAGTTVLAGAVVLVVLHLLPASRELDPMSQPLSQYAFASDGWLFNVGVLALAFGLAVLISALVRGGCLAGRTPACALLCACSLSLVFVVVFPDHNSSGVVTTTGRIHWVAAMLSFGGLSLVPTLLGRHRHREVSACSRLTSAARWLSAGSGPFFLIVLVGSLLRYATPIAVPVSFLGLEERALVALEFAMAGVLTAWAWRGCSCSLERPTRRPVVDLPCAAAADDEPAARLIA